MENSSSKVWPLCFLVGGIYAVIGQIIYTFVAPLVGESMAIIATLPMLGIVAIIMYVPGWHHRLAKVSGFGSILPLNGFACGVADAYQGGYRQGGSAAGFKAVVKMFVGVVVVGSLIDMALGVLGALVTLPKVPVPAAVTGPLVFVTAFIVGGAICLLFQIANDLTSIPMPALLIGGLALGGVLGLFGVSDALAAFGSCGYNIMVIGGGTAVYSTTMLALAGIPIMLIIVWLIFVALSALGIVCAVLNFKVKGKPAVGSQPAAEVQQ